MTQTARRPVFPEQMRIISGSGLKMIAVICMLIDHIGVHLLNNTTGKTILFRLAGTDYTLYRVSRDIGRIAFPIFCFLLIEGFTYTHSRLSYARNLLLFALISELPWNYVHDGRWFGYGKQNVCFTLLLGYLGCWAIEYFREQQLLQIGCVLALLAVSFRLSADYGWRGYIFILIMYAFRYEAATQAIIGSCWLYYEWKACFAFIPINLYNGKRGFIRGKWFKYAFYAFYPVHLMILALLKF
ncbi:MAG: TraX protein [Blautia sp.]|nr:TraX protein [Blautia sp.]